MSGQAAEMFAEAVESCNPQLIREAVAQGARVDRLSGRSVTPLEVALNKCARGVTKARECIATLVELGCSIDGEPDRTPTVLVCTANRREEEDALGLLKVVVPLGANVNAVDPSTGNTALAQAVARGHVKLIQFLLEQGADPTIRNCQGLSAIDWLQARIAKTSHLFSECWKHRQLLSLITGEPTSPAEIVRPQLAECLSVDPAKVTAESRFFDDLEGAADDLRHFMFEIQNKLGVSVEPVIDHVAARFEIDVEGKLTADSLAQIASYVSGWTPPSKRIKLADLFTVSMIESLVQLAVDKGVSPPKTLDESIGETWTEDLIRDIGERRFRLLLAGACRYAFKPYRKSQPSVPTRVALAAIEALERFADTGKSKTDLKRAQKSMADTFVPRRVWTNDRGIHQSFSAEIPLEAPVHVWKRIEDRFGLTGIQALREFVRLSRDVVSPLDSPDSFQNAWRTPEVVELAKQMYEERDFRHMFRLADALQEAGCNDQSILNHCRDSQWIHIRGCWLVDAILDGSWAKPARVKRQKTSLLSKVPKSRQLEVAAIMDSGGALPLEEFVAQRWDVEGYWRSNFSGDVSNHLDNTISALSELHPGLSDEQIRTLLSLQETVADLRRASVARRAVLDDPADLARGLSVLHRIGFSLRGLRSNYSGPHEFLELCAVREFDVAQALAAETRAGHLAIPDEGQLVDIAITAILQRDFDTLKVAAAEMGKQKVGRWLAGFYSSLTGVGLQQPKLVASGLECVLESIHKSRNKGFEEYVINLNAHGLYRLCEWVDPSLVADFDARQAFPWDAEFHQWCTDHPDALQGTDFRSVSDGLHDIVLLQKPPAWLPEPAALYEVVLLDGDPNSKDLANEVGGLAGAKNTRASQQLMKHCPVSLRWNLPQQVADQYCKAIEDLGGTAEVRVMERTPFRWLESRD